MVNWLFVTFDQSVLSFKFPEKLFVYIKGIFTTDSTYKKLVTTKILN